MSHLVAVAKQSSKPSVQQEEKEQEVPGTPVVEPSTPVTTEPEDDQRQPRRTSSGRLRRQEKSVHGKSRLHALGRLIEGIPSPQMMRPY